MILLNLTKLIVINKFIYSYIKFIRKFIFIKKTKNSNPLKNYHQILNFHKSPTNS